MFRKVYVTLELPRFGGCEEEIEETASAFGFQNPLREYGETVVSLTYAVGRKRAEANRKAEELSRYLSETGASIYGCLVLPPPNRLANEISGFLGLIGWVLRHPKHPDRPYHLYLLRWQVAEWFRALLPFHRCACGKYTCLFWRYRDPHYRDGKWIGPDDCLPF